MTPEAFLPMFTRRSNLAFTFLLPSIVIVQVPFPLQPLPLQSAKTETALGVAVRVTTVPTLKEKMQVPPPFSRQLIPGGSLVTVPSPCPDFVTSNVTGKRSNCADTV